MSASAFNSSSKSTFHSNNNLRTQRSDWKYFLHSRPLQLNSVSWKSVSMVYISLQKIARCHWLFVRHAEWINPIYTYRYARSTSSSAWLTQSQNQINSSGSFYYWKGELNTGVYLRNTVKCRYNAVELCKIFHQQLQKLMQNINQMLDPQKTHHTSP